VEAVDVAPRPKKRQRGRREPLAARTVADRARDLGPRLVEHFERVMHERRRLGEVAGPADSGLLKRLEAEAERQLAQRRAAPADAAQHLANVVRVLETLIAGVGLRIGPELVARLVEWSIEALFGLA